MSLPERLAEALTTYTKTIIAVMLVATLLIGSGAGMVDQSTSLDQFESDTPEIEAQDYIDDNFVPPDERDVTRAQVIVRADDGGNVLARESLLESLRYQQTLRDDEEIGPTLTEDDPTQGVSNVVAIAAIQGEQAAELEQRAAELEADREALEEEQRQLENESAALEAERERLEAHTGELRDALNETQHLQREYEQLNLTSDPDDPEYQRQAEEYEARLEEERTNATDDLSEEQAATFTQAYEQVRESTRELVRLEANDDPDEERRAELEAQLEDAYELGTRGVFAEEFETLEERAEDLEERGEELEARGEELEQRGQQLQEDREAFEESEQPPLDEQIDHLESMNDSEVEDVVTTVLDPDAGNGGGAFELMSTNYEPGSATGDARMMLVSQTDAGANADMGEASGGLMDAQLKMQELGDAAGGDEYVVFGAGIIADEFDRSMSDSLTIVGPLALLFVLLALLIAYRDLLDIALGFVGIVLVLVWTFGFMGWTDIAFNQMFVAVPVLLIGLSIDYAIHVFMRHREQRQDRGTAGGDGVRRPMTVALTGVGVALVWVTATTVIGFLSNVISPVPPIREFGVVSAFGIFAALLIFGALIPAAKVELDELLEEWGLDRKKRAFGTGGGRFSAALSSGATLARTAPIVVIVAALLLSAGGAYGASQVDTSFENEDFLADDPPGWMKDLPEPFAPGEYSVKADMEYVNDNFVRQDSQAQVLVENEPRGEGGVTDPETLQRLADAEEAAAETDSAVVLSTGEADIESPLRTMERIAAENESFNETYVAAGAGDDGVPDENVEEVYDELFAAAPDEASRVIHRTDDGEYEAVRMVVSVDGGADFGDVTADMRDIAAVIDGGNGGAVSAIATGGPIINHVIEGQLFDTVLQSLLITLVAVFAFLAITYRIQHGSATLGIVTLLPVALATSWILGTMYLLGMPFNVLTGMITSLTIGLGVAYSIHVSERYNLELGRRGDAWESMRVAVTGTGGALLGSAATTVGGFGVLVFAILPILEQFGLITGMTIIYAFLGSVIVLPSLLVLWTRYLGPAETLDRSEGGDEGPIPGRGAAVDATGEPTAIANGDAGSGDAVRSVDPAPVRPGEGFEASLTVNDSTGRVALIEEVPGVGGHVTELSPRPVDYAQVDRTLYVLWETETPTDLTMKYMATVPDDAPGGTTIAFEGRAYTTDGAIETRGTDAVTVTNDVLDQLESAERITDDHLSTASDRARAGDLADEALERAYRRWATEARPSSPRDADADGGEDGAGGGSTGRSAGDRSDGEGTGATGAAAPSDGAGSVDETDPLRPGTDGGTPTEPSTDSDDRDPKGGSDAGEPDASAGTERDDDRPDGGSMRR